MKKPYRTLRCTIKSDTCSAYTHCGDFALEVTLAVKSEGKVKDLARIEMKALADGNVKLLIYDWMGQVVDGTEFEI